MVKMKSSKGRFNFLLDQSTYEDFSLLCDELGYVRSKQVEILLKEFLLKHGEIVDRLRERKADEKKR